MRWRAGRRHVDERATCGTLEIATESDIYLKRTRSCRKRNAKSIPCVGGQAEKAAVAVATDLATSLAEKETAEEQAAATAELLAVEKQKKDAIDAQEVMTQDASLSTVKRNRAIAQLAILKAEDSQPSKRGALEREDPFFGSEPRADESKPRQRRPGSRRESSPLGV